MKVLLDTTILIDILNGQQEAIQEIERLRKDATLYTTAVNIYEILRGIKRMEKKRERYEMDLKLLIQNIYVLPFNADAADRASEIYAILTRHGKNIDETDYMITGCALHNGIGAIVTRNEKHFGEVEGLQVIGY